jgi:hypothetical protein
MARFKYLGEPQRDYVTTPGPCLKIRVSKKDGTTQEFLPVPPATEFVVGNDIGHDIIDDRSLRAMRVDPRFGELP